MNVQDEPAQDDATHPEPQPEQPAQPELQPEPQPEEPAQFHLRRAPKYGAFGLTGLVIGLIIGLALAFSQPAQGDYTERTIAGYFAASFGLIGVLLGLGAAVIADRRANPRNPRKPKK